MERILLVVVALLIVVWLGTGVRPPVFPPAAHAAAVVPADR